jgi:spore coat polysaccharide biosynthesis predicted glycosyltransferase SpsG
MTSILFRCDATADIGFGHLSRCIALAEALRLSGATCSFAGQYDDAAADQVRAAGFACESLPSPVNSLGAAKELAGLPKTGAIVLDSYRADESYIAGLGSSGARVIVIDDFRALPAYPCDVVLNFTQEAPSLSYPDGPTLLLGPHFLPARRRLVEQRARSIERDRTGAVGNILIAVGGSDPKGLTARLLRCLKGQAEGITVRAIAQSTAELEPLLFGFSADSAILPRQKDLSDQLLWADAAITGGGLIKYESAYMAVPVAAIAQNEGQDGETQVFAKAGLVFDLGLADTVEDAQLAQALGTFLSDAPLRMTMAERMRDAFIADPSAHAAHAILEAVSH